MIDDCHVSTIGSGGRIHSAVRVNGGDITIRDSFLRSSGALTENRALRLSGFQTTIMRQQVRDCDLFAAGANSFALSGFQVSTNVTGSILRGDLRSLSLDAWGQATLRFCRLKTFNGQNPAFQLTGGFVLALGVDFEAIPNTDGVTFTNCSRNAFNPIQSTFDPVPL